MKSSKPAGAVDKLKGVPLDYRGPVLAVAVVMSFALITQVSEPAVPGASMAWTLNPTGMLSIQTWWLMYVGTVPAKHVLDAILNFIGERIFNFKRMEAGSESKVKKLEVLETIDLSYLALNTVVEFIGMNHILAFLLGENVLKHLGAFNVWNGPVAFVLIMVVNDIIYYPFHAVAHMREFYPYVHKQHHRQFLPFRGYADAANQHPVEQSYGFSIFVMSLWLVSKLVGLHAASAWCAALSWAIFNVANHLDFDSLLHLPVPFPAYPRDHQMHHRFPKCNYSTLTTFMDRAFGTYREYNGISEGIKAVKVDKAKVAAEEDSVVPSPWSFIGLAPGLVVCGVVAEIVRSAGSLPALEEVVAVFMPTVALVALAAAGCMAYRKVARLAAGHEKCA